MTMKTDEIVTAVTIQNAITLATAVVMKSAGNDMANQVAGESIETTTVLDDLVTAKIKSELQGKI